MRPKLEPPQHSYCFQCARTHFDLVVTKCPRCGGLCSTFSTHDLGLLQRRPNFADTLVYVARGDKLYES